MVLCDTVDFVYGSGMLVGEKVDTGNGADDGTMVLEQLLCGDHTGK